MPKGATINRKIANNTMAMFARQVFMALISLFTIRVLISKLGIDGFGVMNVTLSVVSLCGFVSSSLDMVTQRYLSHSIGREDFVDLKRYYNACAFLYLLCALLVFILLETLGLWFVSKELVVPLEREHAVNILYQFLIFWFLVKLIFGFHSWVIISHEDMHVFAFFSIVESVLRLVAAILISVFPADALIVYGPLLMSGELVVTVAQWIYCVTRYEECRVKSVRYDWTTLHEMVSFVGWTIFGQFTTICRTQALTILVNQAFSPATVAARALSFTIYNQTIIFARNFTSALGPPIIKSYAVSDKEQTYSLIFLGSRLSFFLAWVVTLPLIALTPVILNLWLGEYPEETVLFTRLSLIDALIITISFPLMTVVRAVGDMQKYELTLGALQLVVLLLSWILVRTGFEAYWIYIVAIVVSFAMFFVRLWLTSSLTGLPISKYFRIVIWPILMVTFVSLVSVFVVLELIPIAEGRPTLGESFFATGLILLAPLLSAAILGLSKNERSSVKRIILQRFGRRKEPS